ncbi:MAG: adenosylcobalamin-dependent ribonucleoside-diphosphate reductase [Planctomycetaceae bacterium]|nr:adenosylcobalamin-dependent ribonucleoside-diphosphate reductase [Planctomycetaceae bacterium]
MIAKSSTLPEAPVASEPKLSPNACTVLEHRYLMRDDGGQVVETPAHLLRRVAKAVTDPEDRWALPGSERERLENEFYRIMATRQFLPNSPTLMNAGRRLGMLSACFVLPLEDSIPEIMETARQIALVQRAGGGTGIDLSRLRPRGSIVRSSGGTTAGPLSFLKMLSGVTDAIQQGAFRRGANMGVMRVDHPDIVAFIDLKSDLAQVTNFNLSVAMTDAFMESLRNEPYRCHVVVNPHTGQKGAITKETGAAEYGPQPASDTNRYFTVRDLWNRILERSWRSGDPGLIFIDEVNRHNPTPHMGAISATNPCGEQPLLPFEACNLGSVNLATHIKQTSVEIGADRIDWLGLRQTVELAVRFLDNVVEANKYPTKEIEEATRATRKIGLGVMGFADLLFQLGFPYDSEQAIELAERIGAFVQEVAGAASQDLAQSRGPFPAWKGSVWDTEHDARPMRNAQVTTIAPTGTISIIAGCSSGIEPVFSLAFTRQVLDGKQLIEVNPVFEASLRNQLTDEKKIEQIIAHAAAHGSIQGFAGLPQQFKAVFRTARDVTPEWHVHMQAAWQRHTDAAVSKTINLSADTSVQDVEKAYLLAYELKCKGITVYRDGARPLQPMALSTSQASHQPAASKVWPARPAKLPELIPSIRLRQPTPFGNMHLHISIDPETGHEREVFAQLGKGGDLANSDLEAICRLVSLLLRLDGDIQMVIDQLDGIGSSLSVPSKNGRIKSLGDGLAQALRKYIAAKDHEGLEALLSGRVTTLCLSEGPAPLAVENHQETLFKIKCPDCDSAGTLAFEEGCLKCHACGYSMC